MENDSSTLFKVSGTVIESHMLKAVLCTIFCCVPSGIIAMIYAARVISLKEEGDYHGALKASRQASSWCSFSFAIGLVQGCLFLTLRLLSAN